MADLELEIRAAAAIPSGATAPWPGTADPTDGGLNVHISGGTIGPPTTADNPLSLADQAATGSAVALGSLTAGPGGLLICCVPSPISTTGSITRVSGSGVAATRGIPLAPGGSVVNTSVKNANQLYIIQEVAGGVISVSQV